MKKIIFVGGNVRSGSTLLNLYLGNQDNALALGELYGLFQPLKKEHTDKISEMKTNDDRWKRIIEGGNKNVYDNIFMEYSEVNVIVDSSKTPFWVEYQTRRNKRKYDVQHILIHKPLEDLAMSFSKRGILDSLERIYVNYHQKWISLFPDTYIVPYKEFVQELDVRKKICSTLGVEFNDSRENIYERTHFNFFGSDSFTKKKIENEPFRFSYRVVEDQQFIDLAEKVRSESNMVRKVENKLIFNSLIESSEGAGRTDENISLSNWKLNMFRMRDWLQKEMKM